MRRGSGPRTTGYGRTHTQARAVCPTMQQMNAGPEAWREQTIRIGGRVRQSSRGATVRVCGRHRALVMRLEQRVEQKLREEETDMGITRKVDAELIRADRAAGLSQTAIAAKHNCARSTVSHYLHAKDTSTAGARARPVRASQRLRNPRIEYRWDPAWGAFDGRSRRRS